MDFFFLPLDFWISKLATRSRLSRLSTISLSSSALSLRCRDRAVPTDYPSSRRLQISEISLHLSLPIQWCAAAVLNLKGYVYIKVLKVCLLPLPSFTHPLFYPFHLDAWVRLCCCDDFLGYSKQLSFSTLTHSFKSTTYSHSFFKTKGRTVYMDSFFRSI